MSRIVHFEIHASDPARAVAFYQGVFGWEVKHLPELDYWLLRTGSDSEPGINGGLMKRRGPEPVEGQAVNAFPCTLGVEDLDATMTKALASGGTVALPKMPVPGVGWLAYLKDTEGNIFGLMQPDTSAKL
jgi:uncharacterized protein